MRIAFDLDNTLIIAGHPFPLEPMGINPLRWIFLPERLRMGTVQLCRQLRKEGHEIWVYTSSMRSVWHIRKVFWLHGIHLHGVVNQMVHDEIVLHRCSKHPPSFHIDLLVDDLPGIALLGRNYGFRVALIAPDEVGWVEQVWAHVRE